jgi:hypothetical protein
MELDELKKMWSETPIKDKSNTKIMELIQDKNNGPLAALKRTYRKRIRLMAIIPFLLLATNLENVDHVLTSVLFWSYVAFCIGIILFSWYNYRVVEKMQTMDGMVKTNLEQQISWLEKRGNMEIMGIRMVMLYFIVLLEVLPYFQHFRMLEKWHSLPLPVRIGAYAGVLLLQFLFVKRIRERKVGRHLTYLKGVVAQMQG